MPKLLLVFSPTPAIFHTSIKCIHQTEFAVLNSMTDWALRCFCSSQSDPACFWQAWSTHLSVLMHCSLGLFKLIIPCVLTIKFMPIIYLSIYNLSLSLEAVRLYILKDQGPGRVSPVTRTRYICLARYSGFSHAWLWWAFKAAPTDKQKLRNCFFPTWSKGVVCRDDPDPHSSTVFSIGFIFFKDLSYSPG